MLTMIVYYHCKKGMRDGFMEALKVNDVAAKSCAEKGNHQYDYFRSEKDEELVLLIEKWDSEEIQKIHMETEHFKLLGGLKAEFVESVEIEKILL